MLPNDLSINLGSKEFTYYGNDFRVRNGEEVDEYAREGFYEQLFNKVEDQEGTESLGAKSCLDLVQSIRDHLNDDDENNQKIGLVALKAMEALYIDNKTNEVSELISMVTNRNFEDALRQELAVKLFKRGEVEAAEDEIKKITSCCWKPKINGNNISRRKREVPLSVLLFPYSQFN
ncbi:MAG: hypothetical protein AAGG81_07165 [Chlamydiota bacterium]